MCSFHYSPNNETYSTFSGIILPNDRNCGHVSGVSDLNFSEFMILPSS